ncbi:MAG: hypothetical protein WD824_15550 [Cyclobacteriaceae bacterium]
MKKVILIFLAAVAFSCGDGSNRSSETGSESQTEENYSDDALDADTTEMEMDTTSSPGMDRKSEVDTVSNRNP